MILRRLDRQGSVGRLGSDEEGGVAIGASRQSTHLLRTMLSATERDWTETEKDMCQSDSFHSTAGL